jgi:molybdopterin-guanine dinucleotide biosynthesis protein B
MRVYGVIGWKNSGKTSLMERLVAEITGRGYSVSTVKHVHHAVDLASADRFALMVEHRGPEPELTTVLARLAPVDLVLVEGYKRDAHPKVEVWREETDHPLIQSGDALVRAVATDADLSLPVPVLDLNDTSAVADFILREVGLV